MIRKLCVLLSFVLFSTGTLWAQDTSFEASVSTTKVALGASLQLTLTIHNGKSSKPIDLPTIDGFDGRYLGPRTHVSIVNGQYSSSVSYVYNLFALKIGKFQIPALNIDIDSKTYTSQPIDVEVVDASSALPAASQPGEGPSVSLAPASLEDKIFLTIETPKKDVYVGEKVPLTMKLFVNQVAVSDVQFPEFERKGFLTDEFSAPQQYTQVVGGIQYQVVEFNTWLYSTEVGDLTLGPAKLACNILYRSSRSSQSPFEDMGGDSFFDHFFNDDFFQGFFNQYQKQPVQLQSPGWEIRVKPLPEENRPVDFSAGVGQFDFKVSVSPTDLKVGDPITLKMTLTGKGNFKQVKMPELAVSDNFKLYDPQIKEDSNQKTVEYILIPKSAEIKEIPPVNFSYFDPEQQKYLTLTQGPFPVRVEKSEEQPNLKVVTASQPGTTISPEKLGQDILFIKETTEGFYPRDYRLLRDAKFLIFVFIVLSGSLTAGFYYGRRERLKTDVIYARRLLAPKKAKKGLEESLTLLKSNQQKEFYDALFRTLQGYLGDKWHVPSAGMTADVIRNTLESKKVSQEILDKALSIVSECDMMRFASMTSNPEKMKWCLNKLEEVIDSLERFKG